MTPSSSESHRTTAHETFSPGTGLVERRPRGTASVCWGATYLFHPVTTSRALLSGTGRRIPLDRRIFSEVLPVRKSFRETCTDLLILCYCKFGRNTRPRTSFLPRFYWYHLSCYDREITVSQLLSC